MTPIAESSKHCPIAPAPPPLLIQQAKPEVSMSAPPSPRMAGEKDRSSSPPPPSDASVEHRGLRTPPHPQPQEDSGSEFELDSPPRITIITKFADEPGSPTSPPNEFRASGLSIGTKPPVSPKGNTFRSDTEEWHSSDAEEDPCFKSLADKFDVAAENVSEDEIDKEGHQRQSDLFANSALMHYNNDENNKTKYELIRAITSCGIMDEKGCYGHVNFTAKGNQQDSKEELFFAEVRREGYLTFVPTCVFSLEGGKSVGGLCDTGYDNFNGMGLPIDAQHCYACGRRLKHPKDGSLYESGHVSIGDYYHG